MVETIDKYKTGLIGLVFLLVGLGGATMLTQDQINNGFVCTSTEKLAICTGTPTHPDALSSTSLSCYYTDETGKDTYTRCSGGIFVPLKDFAESKGVTIDEYLLGAINTVIPEEEQTPTKTGTGRQQICTPEGCTDIYSNQNR